MNLLRRLFPALAIGALLFVSRGAAQEGGEWKLDSVTSAVASPATEPALRRWILVGLDVAAVIGFVVWWRWMGRAEASTTQAGSGALTRFDPMSEAEWKSRALAAEARAEKATALLRAKLMPQLARWMMTEVVQRLLSHRSELVTSQNQAEQEVSDLEKRLEKIHAPLAERLEAYERRIAELERELAAKGEENRELLKAKIASARKKLESERSKEEPLTWN